MKPCPPFAEKRRGGARAFTLLEALLAMLVFSLAVIALVEAINVMGMASVESRKELAVQTRMDDLMLVASRRLGQLAPGTALREEKRQIDEDGVSYQITVAAVDMKNVRGEKLADLYQVVVEARWMEDGHPQSNHSTCLTWGPLFAAPAAGDS
ncbi:MAG: hypothetical protein ACAI34_11160 [Verrucomicrobium sp.]